MRHLKIIAAALLVAYLVFELILNLPALSSPLSLEIALPFYPLGRLTMPTWLLLLSLFTLAFILAVALEVVAWYEYSRTIRLQRKQIIALQKALDQENRLERQELQGGS